MSPTSPRMTALLAAAPVVPATQRTTLLPIAKEVAGRPGAVLVATCHRVELLLDAVAANALDPRVERAFLDGGGRRSEGLDATRHVIDLALGLESAVLGEDQILHQLRRSVGATRERGPLDTDLGTVLDAALRAGRLGRSWRPIQAGRPVSLADVAVRSIASVLGSLRGRRVLVVGSGEMGRSAVRSALASGATVLLASPTPARTEMLAAQLRVDPWPIDPGARIREVDAVVIALRGPWALGSEGVEALVERAAVVDLSMPSAVPEAARERLGDRLVDIDALGHPIDDDREMRRYRARLARLAARTLDEVSVALDRRNASAAAELADRIERQRASELEAWLRRRPELHPDARRELDALSRELSARLFRQPLARLADDPDGRRRRAAHELFG